MEERMKRMESTLEALVSRLPTGNESRNSTEPQPPDDDDGFQGDTAFQAPLNAFNANLASIREKLGYQESASPRSHEEEMRSASHRAISHSSPTESSSSKSLENIRCGPRHLPFPSKAEYVQYLDFFFNDINPCHPCLNEADFRSRCQSLLTTRTIDPSDVCILALNYILFACTDILVHVSPVQERGRLPGWRWYLAADELMQKRKISGRGDLSLAQFLVYEALFPGQPFPETHSETTHSAYLSCMVAFAKFAGEIWDQVFAFSGPDGPELGEKITVLDARIQYWLNTTFLSMPFIPRGSSPTTRQLWQQSLVRTRMNHLRLLLRRRRMVSLNYGTTDGLVCGDVAMDIIRDIQAYAMEVDKPSSYRFHMAISLGGAIIVLATLLCRDLTTINLQDHRPSYTESYHLGMSMLRDLAVTLPSAGRIIDDLRKIVDVVDLIVQDRTPGALQHEDFTNLVPPNMDDLLPYSIVTAGRDMDTDQLEQIYGTGRCTNISKLPVSNASTPVSYNLTQVFGYKFALFAKRKRYCAMLSSNQCRKEIVRGAWED
ncbi:hypothetical protein VFPBJ_01750 [Purpureocillium lilacinum]|uniref:Fungal specific transcription factor domain-containing protein n=1 Tax=Purpureocillium lilacinum TaxID=33203 RepID=A0A179HDV5_PURLI|nr:hypothetical protein VFPBJ_01750 [Purpureocillium lilacinum]